jgi:hypothetical protein
MSVALFTFHGYGTWMPDHERGYVKRDSGVLPPDPEMAENYRRKQNRDAVTFADEHGRVISDAIQTACDKEGWRLHYCITVETHVHPLVSWKDESTPIDRVYNRLKQAAGFALAQHFRTNGQPYFSRGGGEDRKPVVDEEHFEHLMTRYLPDHHGYTFNERSTNQSRGL